MFTNNNDAHSMPAERILVFRGRCHSYLEGIFIPTNFSRAPPSGVTSTNEDGGRVCGLSGSPPSPLTKLKGYW